MNNKILLLSVLFAFINLPVAAQGFINISIVSRRIKEIVSPPKNEVLVQNIRGQVMDEETKTLLPGVHILLKRDTTVVRSTISNSFGQYSFDNVPIGRYTINATHVSYYPHEGSYQVTPAQELIIQIPLRESYVELEVINFKGGGAGYVDVLAEPIEPRVVDLISGTMFDLTRSIKQVNANPPLDDSRNDVVVRGNSPSSIVWRLNGINIPNPNHFSIPGTTGGPISLINSKMLASSAFYSGAVPAEFGNTTSGVFDLYLRDGDSIRHNWTLQYGLLGADYTHEGPLSSRHKSSFIIQGRHSVLHHFQRVGLDVGIDAKPVYFDGSFKLSFPMKNNSSLSFFGIGGSSKIDILISEDHRNFYGERDRDQLFLSRSFVTGLTYENSINNSAALTSTVGVSSEQIAARHNLARPSEDVSALIELNGNPQILHYDFRESRISHAIKYTQKLGGSTDSTRIRKWSSTLKAGVITDVYVLNYQDSAANINGSPLTNPDFGVWRQRWATRTPAVLVQPYFEWRYAIKRLDFLTGIHAQYFSVSDSYSPFEPRVALKYYIRQKNQAVLQNVYASYGLQSQIQSPYLYFYGSTNDDQGNPILQNTKMDFTRSSQVTWGYERYFGPDSSRIRFKTEFYYQYLYRVPVTQNDSSFSLLNTGATFTRLYPEALVNQGIGRNYGVEVSVSRFISRGYLFMLNGSLFQSQYKASDNLWRNTTFNSNYVVNGIFTREKILKRQDVLTYGIRISVAGGRRYGQVDMDRTVNQREVIYRDEDLNELQFKTYFRTDLRISYKHNRPRVSHEIVFDLLNVTNQINILRQSYDPSLPHPVTTEFQFGFVPVFYYRFSRSNFNAIERTAQRDRLKADYQHRKDKRRNRK